MRPFSKMAKLTFIASTPCPDSAISSCSHAMSIFLSTSARNTDYFFIGNSFNFFRSFNLVFIAMTKLIEITLAPRIHLTFLTDCQRMSKSCANFCPYLIFTNFFEQIKIILRFVTIECVMSSTKHLPLC